MIILEIRGLTSWIYAQEKQIKTYQALIVFLQSNSMACFNDRKDPTSI